MNKRVEMIARRAMGPDVVRAATGVARPVPLGSLVFTVVLLGLLLAAATTRSWWAVAGIGAVLAVGAVVVAAGHNRRVLVGVVDDRVEVRRLRLGFFVSSGPLVTAPAAELKTSPDNTRAFALYLAPGGLTEIGGLPIALNQPLD